MEQLRTQMGLLPRFLFTVQGCAVISEPLIAIPALGRQRPAHPVKQRSDDPCVFPIAALWRSLWVSDRPQLIRRQRCARSRPAFGIWTAANGLFEAEIRSTVSPLLRR